MYLKQIVCESEWEKDKCVNKISEITNNPMLRTALDNADLNIKKLSKIFNKTQDYQMLFIICII